MKFLEVGELTKGVRVSKGNEDHSEVGKGGQDVHDNGLLSSSCRSSGDEGRGVFSSEGSLPQSWPVVFKKI